MCVLINHQHLQQLCQIAFDAGKEIMDVYAHGGEVFEKQDKSPLTEADLRADDVISKGLTQHFPQWTVVSEETHDSLTIIQPLTEASKVWEQAKETFFLVDPLDGTKEFIKRSGEFTVNIALVHAGQPVAGVVFAPALDELFYGAQGLGVFKQDAHGTRSISTRPVYTDQALRVMGSRSHGTEQLEQWLQSLNRPYTFVGAGSSLKFCRIAEGQADVYPRFSPTSQWDTAAGQAILELAGGRVVDMTGEPMTYSLDACILNPYFVANAR
jgi:3'(2'), 5'-bisphosphate nucleotidase